MKARIVINQSLVKQKVKKEMRNKLPFHQWKKIKNKLYQKKKVNDIKLILIKFSQNVQKV